MHVPISHFAFLALLLPGEAPPTPVPSSNVGREAGNSHARVPGLWVVIIVLVATALLALNVSAIVCIVRRRRNKRGSTPQSKKQHLTSSSSSPKGIALSSSSPHLTRSGKLPLESNAAFRFLSLAGRSGEPHDLLLHQVLGGRGDLPKLIIIAVAIVGTFIVILNIALVICLIRRKRGRSEDGTEPLQ